MRTADRRRLSRRSGAAAEADHLQPLVILQPPLTLRVSYG